MEKNSVIRCLLAIALTVYLVFALMMSSNLSASARCAGFDIRIHDNPGQKGFISDSEITRMLHEWKLDDTGKTAAAINLGEIERRLNGVSTIETANVQRMPDNRIRIDITPMVPVARVFDSKGRSYYINRQGKSMTANSRFHIDVPVIAADFNRKHPATDVLPVVERLEHDPEWKALISHYRVDPRNGDIILVPVIRGHVINLGDTTALDSKLQRVLAMYHKVLPLKGWEYYDTLSVKWGGQCVATRRDKSIPESMILFDQEGEAEEENVESMLVSTESDTVHAGTPAYAQ